MSRIALLALLAAGLLAAPAQAQESVSPELATRGRTASELRLPPKVFLFVSVPSVEELKSRWSKSQFGRLLDDRALTEFRADLSKQIAQYSEEVDRNLGLPLEELLAIPSGETTLAVLQTDEKLAVVGLLDFGRSRAEIDKLLEKAQAALKEEGAERKSARFEGTEIVTYVVPADEDDDESTDETKLAYCIKDTHIVAASDVSALEAVLARWSGRHEQTFAGNEIHRYIQGRTVSQGGVPVVSWFIDPLGLLKAALEAGEEADIQAGMVLGFLPQLGIENLKGIGGTAELVTPEFDSVSRTFIYVDSPAAGLLSVFRFPARDLAPPRWVTAQVAGYSAANWDIQGAYAAVEKLVDDISMQPGMFKQMVDSFANQPGAPNVHPKTDFVDQLTGQFHFVSDFADPDDFESSRMLVALDLKDAARMKAVLATIAKTEGFPGTSREFRGETIYEIAQDAPLGGGVQMAVGVAQGHLMFTSHVTLLEQVLRQDQDQQPLAESAAYKKVAAKFPEKVSTINYSRDAMAVQGIYKAARSGQFAGVMPLDFTKLPQFEDLQKYLSESGGYTVPDRNGALMVDFTLKTDND